MYAVRFAQFAILAPILAAVVIIRLNGDSVSQAFRTALTIEGAYLTGLWTSMLIYRAFFHRLRSFPGPSALKLSKFAHFAQLGHLDNYKRLDAWHEKYGDFVRTGPSELSIVAPEAVEAIMGARSACFKAAWYDMGAPLVSLHQTRDRQTHDKRRRVWDKGFSMKGDYLVSHVIDMTDSKLSTRFVPVSCTVLRGLSHFPDQVLWWLSSECHPLVQLL